MTTTSCNDAAWADIIALTHCMARHTNAKDSVTLLTQFEQRDDKIRDYFKDIDQHSERLHDIKQRIADLLSLDEHIIGSCRTLQAEALQELGTARRAEQGLKAYSANQSAGAV